MSFENSLFNTGLDAMAGAITSVSIHTDDPGATGANEVSGGSYTRQTPSWAAASGGSVSTDSNLTFDIPGGNTTEYAGLWSSGPTWEGSILLSDPETFTGDGQLTITQIIINMVNEGS